MEGPGIGCSITHLAGNDLMGTTIRDSKGRTSGQGQLTTDDGISTHKAACEVKEMHGTTAPMRATRFLTE